MFLHLFASFSFTRSLLDPYAYLSIESIDFFLLSPFELKAILLISSVKTLCLSLLIFVVFLILIYCFYEFFVTFFKTSYGHFIFVQLIYLLLGWVASKQFLQFSNLSFLFMTHIFVSFAFLSSLPHLLSNYKLLLLIQQILSLFFQQIYLH